MFIEEPLTEPGLLNMVVYASYSITQVFFSRPGQSQGLLYKPPRHSFIQLQNRLCHSYKDLTKSWRASKSHHWFKIYHHFSEGVNFVYWQRCIRKGQRLKPAQQACSLTCNWFKTVGPCYTGFKLDGLGPVITDPPPNGFTIKKII